MIAAPSSEPVMTATRQFAISLAAFATTALLMIAHAAAAAPQLG